MMTQPPGPAPHHPGDGCTGEHRPLTPADTVAVRTGALNMVLHASLARDHTEAAWEGIATMGSGLARHYGPEGEWLLAVALARYVTDHTAPDLRGSNGVPFLHRAVPPCDPQAAALLLVLARRHHPAATTEELCAHLEAARLMLQSFMAQLHLNDEPGARATWLAVVSHGGEPPFTALAFTAQLIIWASRAALPGRKPPIAARPAALN